MRRLLFLFICIVAFNDIQAQSESSIPPISGDNTVYNSGGIEVKPEFKGGLNKFYEYISKNYRTPEVPGLKGKLLISFVVEKDGSIADIKVLKDIGYGTAEEAIRLLKNCPKWTPAEQQGKKVRCSFMLPLNIQSAY
jgi:protein TonB